MVKPVGAAGGDDCARVVDRSYVVNKRVDSAISAAMAASLEMGAVRRMVCIILLLACRNGGGGGGGVTTGIGVLSVFLR